MSSSRDLQLYMCGDRNLEDFSYMKKQLLSWNQFELTYSTQFNRVIRAIFRNLVTDDEKSKIDEAVDADGIVEVKKKADKKRKLQDSDSSSSQSDNESSKTVKILIKDYQQIPNLFLSLTNGAGVSTETSSLQKFSVKMSPYRGLLVYHDMGVGKTMTGVHLAYTFINNYRAFLIKKGLISKKSTIGKVYIMRYQRITQNWDDQIYSYLSNAANMDKKKIKSFVQDHIVSLKSDPNAGRIKDYQSIVLNHNMVIIDEVHNVISYIFGALKTNNEKSFGYFMYKWLMDAKDTKLVFLTGTPMINNPYEIIIMLNILKGPMKDPFKEDKMYTLFGEYDTYDRLKWINDAHYNSFIFDVTTERFLNPIILKNRISGLVSRKRVVTDDYPRSYWNKSNIGSGDKLLQVYNIYVRIVNLPMTNAMFTEYQSSRSTEMLSVLRAGRFDSTRQSIRPYVRSHGDCTFPLEENMLYTLPEVTKSKSKPISKKVEKTKTKAETELAELEEIYDKAKKKVDTLGSRDKSPKDKTREELKAQLEESTAEEAYLEAKTKLAEDEEEDEEDEGYEDEEDEEEDEDEDEVTPSKGTSEDKKVPKAKVEQDLDKLKDVYEKAKDKVDKSGSRDKSLDDKTLEEMEDQLAEFNAMQALQKAQEESNDEVYSDVDIDFDLEGGYKVFNRFKSMTGGGKNDEKLVTLQKKLRKKEKETQKLIDGKAVKIDILKSQEEIEDIKIEIEMLKLEMAEEDEDEDEDEDEEIILKPEPAKSKPETKLKQKEETKTTVPKESKSETKPKQKEETKTTVPKESKSETKPKQKEETKTTVPKESKSETKPKQKEETKTSIKESKPETKAKQKEETKTSIKESKSETKDKPSIAVKESKSETKDKKSSVIESDVTESKSKGKLPDNLSDLKKLLEDTKLQEAKLIKKKASTLQILEIQDRISDIEIAISTKEVEEAEDSSDVADDEESEDDLLLLDDDDTDEKLIFESLKIVEKVPNVGVRHKYNLDEITTLSAKLEAIFTSITDSENKELHFVYSRYIVYSIFHLEAYLRIAGYSEFKYELSKSPKKNLQRIMEQVDKKGKKFYIKYTNPYSGIRNRELYLERGENQKNDKALMKCINEIFNHPLNKEGKYIKVLLGTAKAKEGINLKNVRHVHIFEPWWNITQILQAIGRAFRFQSHISFSDLEERYVKVDLYVSSLDEEQKKRSVGIQSTDEMILSHAIKKMAVNKVVDDILSDSAIDCGEYPKDISPYLETEIDTTANDNEEQLTACQQYFQTTEVDIAYKVNVLDEKTDHEFINSRVLRGVTYAKVTFEGYNYLKLIKESISQGIVTPDYSLITLGGSDVVQAYILYSYANNIILPALAFVRDEDNKEYKVYKFPAWRWSVKTEVTN